MTCPDGHSSADPDYCDVCGLPMTATTSSTPQAPSATPSPAPAVTGGNCPVCASPRVAPDERFCENCGYDYVLDAAQPAAQPAATPDASSRSGPASGESPPPAQSAGPAAEQPPSLPGSGWVAVVTADRDYYERVMALGGEDADEINFPPYAPERRIPLTVNTVRIGRHSVSTGDVPEIDLRQAPPDPGVSQLHAVLMRDQDGAWTVVDVGSTNGTTVNGGSEPLAANTPVPLAAGDRVHVGAWTTITMEAL